jgi:hypothetical protein
MSETTGNFDANRFHSPSNPAGRTNTPAGNFDFSPFPPLAGESAGCTSRPVVLAAFASFVCIGLWLILMFFELVRQL